MEKACALRYSRLRAFSGELIGTEAEIARRKDGDYDTAEVLVERIKEDREEWETNCEGIGTMQTIIKMSGQKRELLSLL